MSHEYTSTWVTYLVDRAAIFLKAAELVATKYRFGLIAAAMLGQGKNIWQGEVDAAAELADFFRLNYNYAAEILEKRAERGTDEMWSRMDYRPVEGFVYAVSPFNFTAIGGNLISSPATMGNVVLWKPSPSNIYASTIVYKIYTSILMQSGDRFSITGILRTIDLHTRLVGGHALSATMVS